MRLLFVAPQLPYPPVKGGAIRLWGLLRALAGRHEVHVHCLADGGPLSGTEDGRAGGIAGQRDGGIARSRDSGTAGERATGKSHRQQRGDEGIPELEAAKLAELGIGLTCSPTIGARGKLRRGLDLWRWEPDLALRLRSEQLSVDLRALLQAGRFDLAQVESLETAPLWLRAVQVVAGPPAVLDEFNAEFLLQYRAVRADVESPRRWPVALYSAVQALKLRRYEAQVGRAFERVLAVSRQDARALAPLVGRERLRVVPNTVEVPPFRPTLARTGGANVVFVGTMDYRPNVDAVTWFAERVLPLLQSTRGARFTIVGARPTERVLTLAKQSNVVVTGVVPDVLPYLADADVAVAPIRFGSGSRLKILEALAASVPVVSTTVGAEGLDLRHAEHLLIADEPLAFAQAVSRVLEDDELRCRLAATGHARVAERYDWRALGPKLDAIYAEVIGRGSH